MKEVYSKLLIVSGNFRLCFHNISTVTVLSSYIANDRDEINDSLVPNCVLIANSFRSIDYSIDGILFSILQA